MHNALRGERRVEVEPPAAKLQSRDEHVLMESVVGLQRNLAQHGADRQRGVFVGREAEPQRLGPLAKTYRPGSKGVRTNHNG